MPSGRTHDAITFLLAVPAVAVTYLVTQSISSCIIIGGAFVFGGLMFGPDLDTVSRQYSRWFIFRFLWFPYRSFFAHRSRFSHGLIFGALLRVVYFMGVTTLLAYLLVYTWMSIAGGKTPAVAGFAIAWSTTGNFVRSNFGEDFFLLGQGVVQVECHKFGIN